MSFRRTRFGLDVSYPCLRNRRFLEELYTKCVFYEKKSRKTLTFVLFLLYYGTGDDICC